MKLVTLSLIAAAGTVLFGAATVAEAGPKFSVQFGSSGYGAGSHGYYSSGHGYGYGHGYSIGYPSHGNHGHCAQPYKVSTVEVNRYTQCRTAYDHCGRPYTVHVTVVTYCDHYSNGTTRTWSRTFS